MNSWNVLHCVPRSEVDISKKLEDFGFESLCPTYRMKSLFFGRPVENVIPIISSYVFFRGQLDDSVWHQVRRIGGVLQILNGDVNECEVKNFCEWVGEDGDYWKLYPNFKHDICIGQQVAIKEGMFEGCEGSVVSVSEKFCEVQLNSSLLGRVVVVKQPVFWCGPCSETSAFARSDRRPRRGGKRHNRRRRTQAVQPA